MLTEVAYNTAEKQVKSFGLRVKELKRNTEMYNVGVLYAAYLVCILLYHFTVLD